jgi:uncharacterized protein
MKISKAAIFLTEGCNLRCDYCYQSRNNPKSMDLELSRKTADFLLNNSGDSLAITFFGGEPLLKPDLLKEIIDYTVWNGPLMGKRVAFSINTNGTLLDEDNLKLLSDNRVSIVLSIDGKKETHDYHRKTANGEGSFSLLNKNLPHILNYPLVQARLTVSPDSIYSLFENIKFIEELGFKKSGIALTRDSNDWTPERIEELKNQYDIMIDWYINKIREGTNFSITDIDLFVAKGDRKLKSGTPSCSAGEESIAIGVDGLIYPCHRFVGYRETSIGDIDKGLDEEKRNYYRGFDPYRVEGCEECSFLSNCYKCMWLSYVKHGMPGCKVPVACAESKIFILSAEKVRKIYLTENNLEYNKRISIIEKMFRKNGKKEVK